MTIGDDSAKRVVKHALAMGADKGILLQDPAFEGSDSFATAYILSQAIQKLQGFDLVLCGRQAADWDEGLVGSILAENLELPLITLAESVDFIEGSFHVKRVILDGCQVFAVSPPTVLTVGHELGPPRLPSGWGIITASKKEIPVWDAKHIDAELAKTGADAEKKKLAKLVMPERERMCEMIEVEELEDTADMLIKKMRDARVL
jgi:electron transfer flavoprotein beta subunit